MSATPGRLVPRYAPAQLIDDYSAELPTAPAREAADPCSSSREAPFPAGEASTAASPAGPDLGALAALCDPAIVRLDDEAVLWLRLIALHHGCEPARAITFAAVHYCNNVVGLQRLADLNRQGAPP
mgnify:CR=1 FL=1